MQMDEYAEKALSYRLPSADESYALLNLVSEVGELLGHFARHARDAVEPCHTSLTKELGDILWHIAAISDDLGVTLEEVAAMNLEKLRGRKERGTIQGAGDDR